MKKLFIVLIHLLIIFSTHLALGDDCTKSIFDAVKKGDTTTVKKLIESGCDVNSKDNKGFTLLMEAALAGKVKVAKLLLENGADKDATTRMGASSLMLAATMLKTDVVKLLLDNGAKIDNKIISGILDEGATAFILAIGRSHMQGGHLEKAHIDIASLLLAKGADIEAKTKYGSETALTFAAKYVQYEVAEFLLKNGADPNSTDKKGDTPLIISARIGHPEIVKILIKNGADPNKKNKAGMTAIMIAEDQGKNEIVKILK